VAKKELNLLQFTAGGAAEPSATPPTIVRCEFGDANLGGKLLDPVPDQLFRYSFAPSSAGAVYPPEKLPGVDGLRFCPFVYFGVHPIWHGNGSNMTGLASEIHDCTVSFALLEMIECQLGEFVAAESACKQEGKQRPSGA
jgi:hypothetical protein